jgi:hypothetical protein
MRRQQTDLALIFLHPVIAEPVAPSGAGVPLAR